MYICRNKNEKQMNLEEVQNYFKEQISLGNYEVTDKYQASFGYKKLWVSVLVSERPFMIEITPKGKVEQLGDITENFIQLGKFNNEQQKKIYERYEHEL